MPRLRRGAISADPVTPPTFQLREIEWTADRVRRFWSFVSQSPHASEAYFSSHSGDALIALVERRLPLTRSLRLLDWGCGPGFLLERLCRRGYIAEGLEFSEDSLAQATARCRALPTFKGVTLAQSLPTPLAAAGFDVVFLIEVIEHLSPDQLRGTLSEIHRVLKPGGAVVMTTPHDENLERAATVCPDCGLVFHPWQHIGSFTTSSLAQLAASHGFVAVSARATTIGAPALSKITRTIRRMIGRDAPQPHLMCIARRP